MSDRSAPAGMKPYGPDHADYPNPPRDQARLGLPVRRSGANAVGIDWKHHAPDHHRYPSDIVAYWPDAALATTPSPDADPELIYEALRFYIWAAGEGICPVNGENALEPEEGLFQYSNRTGDENWETIAARYRARTVMTSSPDAPTT